MRRPVFLANITRTPSLKWTCRKLVGFALRRVRGIEREPIRKEPLTEDQWRALEHKCGLLTGSLFGALVCIVFLLLYRGSAC